MAQKWYRASHAKGAGTMTVTTESDGFGSFEKVRAGMDEVIQGSRNGLLAILRTAAPKKTGALRSGIVASPAAERSAVPGKIVHDIYMDEGMNDTFVKYSLDGKRYYYPASQEYGFRLKNGGYKPGRYYMRDTTIRYEGTFVSDVKSGLDKVLEEL